MAETDTMVKTYLASKSYLASDAAAEHYAKTMPPPKPVGPVEPLPVLDPAELNRRLDIISRSVWMDLAKQAIREGWDAETPSAEQLWEALAAEWDSEGGLNKDRAIAIMRTHGLR